jgi:enoyl-[acyl-carrier-protein] reductase (NADH)
MLKRLPTLEELSNVASFVASDKASALTGSVIKIDCGA